MIAKYPTATLAEPIYERTSLVYDGTRYYTYRHPRFGSAGVTFAAALPEPERSRYRSYFPTAEDFLDGEWVCLPRDHEILGTFILEHIGTILGFGQTLIPLVSHGTHVAYGRLYHLIAGVPFNLLRITSEITIIGFIQEGSSILTV
jgi:hypothetical protein